MIILDYSDLAETFIWVRPSGFPGHLADNDVRTCRRLLQNPKVASYTRVLINVGADTHYLITRDAVNEARLEGGNQQSDVGDGYAMPDGTEGLGYGDGATLAGYPIGWSLLRFVAPDSCVVLLTSYPATLPICPHGELTKLV